MIGISNHSAGTIGGTLMTIAGVIDLGDIVKTATLAMIGAVVSFVVSAVMKRLFTDKKTSHDP